MMKSNLKASFAVLILLQLTFLPVQSALSHCQVPCGIYDDEMRFDVMAEHITTIEKSMKQIMELEKATPINYNQMVRWVNNKDQHADELADIVSYYFLAQRVKPVAEGDVEASRAYRDKLTLLHQMIFYAMKTKQTTDLAHVETLRSLLKEFHESYFDGKHEHQH